MSTDKFVTNIEDERLDLKVFKVDGTISTNTLVDRRVR